MILAFYNMETGGEEAAVNMIATGLALQTLKRVRVLMLESEFGRHDIEKAIAPRRDSMVKEPFSYMEGEGMDYLMKKSSNQLLSETNAKEGIIYVKENLGYVPGVVKKSRMMYEYEFGRECRNILKKLDQMADYILIDCSCTSDFIRNEILNAAGLVVVNVSQREMVLDEYFSCLPFFWNKAVYCIGNYIGEEPCNLKNIQRLYRIEHQNIGIIPYNVEFLAALRKGRVVSFFQNHHLRARNQRNKDFFDEVFNMVQIIFKWEESLL